MKSEHIKPLRQVIKHVFDCPECGAEIGGIDHLTDEHGAFRAFGPWYCPGCGLGWYGEQHESGVRLQASVCKCLRSLALLRRGDLHLVVESVRHDDSDDESARYFYEEHTCPTNYLSMVVECIVGSDRDPHGAFEYVGELDRAVPERELQDTAAREAMTDELLAKFGVIERKEMGG